MDNEYLFNLISEMILKNMYDSDYELTNKNLEDVAIQLYNSRKIRFHLGELSNFSIIKSDSSDEFISVSYKKILNNNKNIKYELCFFYSLCYVSD